MKTFLQFRLITALLVAALSAGQVLAEKPDWAGQGKQGKHEQKQNGKGKKQKYEGETADVKVSSYFTEPQRTAVRNYYGQQSRSGRCPPGLAKKNNGCMPPGQAKKWNVGQTLPGYVISYPVPSAIVIQLGLPPVGHKYVRVAGDILLIAIGTSLIVDAVKDLGRL